MAEFSGLPIPTMDWHSPDAPQAFKKFKARCQLYFNGPLKDKSEEEQVNYLLIWSGDDGIELVSTWSLSDEEKKKLDAHWTRFEQYLSPRSNFRLSRFKLRTAKQEPGEAVDSFIKRLRILVEACQFTNPEEHIIDALIFGSSSKRTQSKLLEFDKTLTLNQALEIARTEEITNSQMKSISSTHVDALRHFRKPTNSPSGPSIRLCGNCGIEHNISDRSSCPAYGTTCKACGKENHWQRVCRSKLGKRKHNRPKDAHAKQKHQDKSKMKEKRIGALTTADINPNTGIPLVTPALDQLYFHTLSVNQISNSNTQALVQVQVNFDQGTKPLWCKVDTGAEGNVIPIETYKTLSPTVPCDANGIPMNLKPSSTVITAYGGYSIRHYGTCVLNLSHENYSKPSVFHVVDTKGPTILGLPTCTDLDLITLNYSITTQVKEEESSCIKPCATGNTAAKDSLVKQYGDCFEGIGCFQGDFHITLDPLVPPVVHPPRRVPEALKGSLKKELDSLVEQGIITRVEQPTDWVNSLVCVTKSNGDLRICLDPKDLNRAIKRPHHFTPTLDDVLSKLNGASWFSILDARSGYWNIKLDQQSSLYTTFNSPYGRYRFLRLPFGLVCAQDIFQRKVDETFSGLAGVAGIADEIIVYGRDRINHDKNLDSVMQRARQTGLKFNQGKCQIGCKSIPFFGHVISVDGLQPDPKKIEAIVSMDPSSNVDDLRSFLGMVQFLSRFIPGLATLAANLWALTKTTSEFVWSPEHQIAVDKIKKAIITPTSLQYFDNTALVEVQVDASQRGVGAVLFQDNGPVEFASKLLTETEMRYSNIEREMLAVLFGLEKFHYYVYERPVVVYTDHKPLEAIFKKHLASAPPRISRMMLRIQKYDVQIKYVPGKNVPVADALSRVSYCSGDTVPGLDITIHEVLMNLNVSSTRVPQIQEETAKDTSLSALSAIIAKGWPEKRSECPAHLHPYWNYCEELTVSNGMILKGSRIIIPKSLQADVLQQLHYAHQGAEKCKLRAKGSVFWPNINRDIEETVHKCSPCQRHQKLNTKESLMSHEIPPQP